MLVVCGLVCVGCCYVVSVLPLLSAIGLAGLKYTSVSKRKRRGRNDVAAESDVGTAVLGRGFAWAARRPASVTVASVCGLLAEREFRRL